MRIAVIKTMEVILIRHTKVGVAKGTCYGQTDVPLAETFEQEAAVTKHELEAYGPFDAVYSSPLSRATKLAAYCGYPEPLLDDRLMEMNMGEWEMQLYDEINDSRLDAWYNDYMHLPTPGGESFPMMRQRVAAFLDDVKMKDYQRIAVFTHGGVLIAASLYAGLYSETDAWQHQTDYGGVIRIRV